MHRNKSVDAHQFAMVPRADIPRSAFLRESAHKTTFNAGYLVPVYVDEVLPGDTFNMRATMFARMATPLFPVMDNAYMDVFWFFCPARLLWSNFKKFMGEQATPASSISYTIPQMVSPANGYAINSLHDYLGLGTVGQITAGATQSHNSLPLRMYNFVYNEWFRDENLQDSVTVDLGDGPDTYSNYSLLRRGKRHDYFTSALPWPQKGNTAVTLPLGTSAPVRVGGTAGSSAPAGTGIWRVPNNDSQGSLQVDGGAATNPLLAPGEGVGGVFTAELRGYADLTAATAATINQIRQAFQIQKLLERDARGGTRYTEIVRAHFGVISPDARLQRPEYLGGASIPINVTPIAQTAQDATDPMGTLAGVATALGRNGFTQSFTEHGYIMCLVSVRADLTYQQGLERMWSRSTRYDFYFPAFAMLGEQSVLNKEIYAKGSATGGITAGDQDMNVFGYQERWAELRYKPSKITGLFRSTAASNIDSWHLSQEFTALPTLNSTFIQDTPPFDRVIAVGSAANGQQFIFDSVFSCRSVRPLPMYSVPGLLDHF